jgi:hypothetical protein
VDLSDLRDQPQDAQVLAEATDRIMDSITALVADLRDQPAPSTRLDPKDAGLPEIGRAHVRYDDSDRSP